MARYSYTGVTRDHAKVNGTLDAEDEVEARMQLRAMHVRALTLKKNRDKIALSADAETSHTIWGKISEMSLGSPLDRRGMYVFTRQFSSLIDAGVPVVQCLDILGEQTKSPAFKKIMLQVKAIVESGSTLAAALSKFPQVFPEIMVTLIESGEVSGTLDIALRRIGIQLEKSAAIRSKIKAAITYPIITIIVAAGVLLFLLIKVIPEISKLYAESNAKLPDLTLQVLAFSTWVQEYYPYLLGGMFGISVGFSLLYRVDAFREVWDPVVLKLPLFGDLILKAIITRFTRTMSTLVASGVPLLNSFEIAIKVINNRWIESVIRETAIGVQEGKGVAAGLGKGKTFPPMVVHMVSIGEITGKLDEMFGKVADIYEEEVDEAVNTLTSVIQPALIVIVGGLVAFLLLAMYMPLFTLAETVAGV